MIQRLKAIQTVLADKELIKLMADFKRQKFAGITIVENQIEDEEELASFYLRQLEKQIFKTYESNKR